MVVMFYDHTEHTLLWPHRTSTVKTTHNTKCKYTNILFNITVFAIGNLIYVGLELEYHLGGHVPRECNPADFGWTFVLRLIFLIVQTFFIFKNPKVSGPEVNVQQTICKTIYERKQYI